MATARRLAPPAAFRRVLPDAVSRRSVHGDQPRAAAAYLLGLDPAKLDPMRLAAGDLEVGVCLAHHDPVEALARAQQIPAGGSMPRDTTGGVLEYWALTDRPAAQAWLAASALSAEDKAVV